MKILIACEFSGIVRDDFRKRGHEAYSCDLIDCERGNLFHIKHDVIDVIDGKWDMMIAFPPCTHLSVSGARWFKDKQQEQKDAIEFFLELALANIEKVAIENPVGIMSTKFRKPDQIIQPWQFGHPESKKTCFWLRNLPKLIPTNILPLPERGYWDNQTPSGQNKLGPSPTRAQDRGRTYVGIAKAMAEQWG